MGLDDKVKKYALDINRLSHEHKKIYNSFREEFNELCGIHCPDKFYVKADVLRREIQLFESVDRSCYHTLNHLLSAVMGSKYEEFHKK